MEQEPIRPAAPGRISLHCCYCHGELVEEEAVYCASCLTPQHGDCHQGHGGCAAPGCRSRSVVRAQRVGLELVPLAAHTLGNKLPPRARRKWVVVFALVLSAGAVLALTLATTSLSLLQPAESERPPGVLLALPSLTPVQRARVQLELSTRGFALPLILASGERLVLRADSQGYTTACHLLPPFHEWRTLLVAEPGDTIAISSPSARREVVLHPGERAALTVTPQGGLSLEHTLTSE